MPTGSSRSWLLGACLLLLLLPFLFFWQVWWPDPAYRLAFEEGDFTLQYFPMQFFAARSYRQGRLPLWSPYTYSGEPVVAESLYAVFYPLSLWRLLLPTFSPFILEIEVLVYLGLATVSTFLLVRELTENLAAGVLAGVAFGLGGFLTSYPMLQVAILQVALWLPVGLWLLERALQRRSLIALGLAGIAFGAAVLGGHFQTFLYIVYLTAAYFLFRVFYLHLDLRFALKAAVLLAVIVVGVGAPQWLPSAEIAGRSPRADLSYEAVAHGFALDDLWGLVRPNLGEWSPLYVGWIPLALALLAVFALRKAETWFWAAVVLVALLLSLGGNGFLYPLFHAVAPGFDLFRDQERSALLVTFGLAILAGYGYDLLVRRWPWLGKAGPVLLVLALFNLYYANQGAVLQPLPPGGYTPSSEVVTYLQAEQDAVARISSESNLPLGGNAGLYYGLRDVTGDGPLHQAHYDLFLELVPEVRWWQLLNVEHVVTERTFDYPGISLALDDVEQNVRVHRLDFNQRPVWITHDVEVMPNQEAAIYFTSDMGRVDPVQTAVLETAPDPAPRPVTGAESARITDFSPHRVVAEVELSAPGVVVFSEIDYPGWIAYANGERVERLRAFGILRAVALPAGEWEIEWRFRPLTVYVGLALCAVTVLGLSVGFAYRKMRSTD